jgi:hypothetical protein
MTSSPLALTVAPVKVTLPAGQRDAVVWIKVTDSGTKPITVVVSRSLLVSRATDTHCGLADPPSWLSIRPAILRLDPGQARWAQVTVHAPATASGTHDLLAVFTASGSQAGQVRMGAAVASQVIVRASGHQQAIPVCGKQVPKALPYHPPSASFPIVPVLLAVAAALGILAALWFTLRRRRA